MQLTIKNNINRLPIKGLNNNYKIDVKLFNNWLNGRAVSPVTIAEFFAERMNNCKPSTLRRNKASIKKALRLALGENITLDELARFKAFFDEIKPNKINVEITDEKILTRQEINELLKICGHKTGLIVRALFETACRVSELLNIKLKDCKPGRREITIKLYRSKTKTTDYVYMSKDLFDEIASTYQGNKYLFEKEDKPLSRFTVHTLIKNAGRKIGKPEIHAHTFRHSWGSAVVSTLGLAKTSKYLGHSRTDTTSQYYLHGKPSEAEVTAFNALQFAD